MTLQSICPVDVDKDVVVESREAVDCVKEPVQRIPRPNSALNVQRIQSFLVIFSTAKLQFSQKVGFSIAIQNEGTVKVGKMEAIVLNYVKVFWRCQRAYGWEARPSYKAEWL